MAKYSKGAGKKVESAMREMKEGKLKSGRIGKKVTNPKQAIAIGLSEARERGAKVPAKKGATKSSGSQAADKSATKKGATKSVSKSAPKKAGSKGASKAGAKKGSKAASKKGSRSPVKKGTVLKSRK